MKTKFLTNKNTIITNILKITNTNKKTFFQINNNNNINFPPLFSSFSTPKKFFTEKNPQKNAENPQENKTNIANLLKKPYSSTQKIQKIAENPQNQNENNLNFIFSTKQEKKILKTSLIRELDIGKNYFSHINPRRKKLLTTLLNSYIKALKKTEEVTELITALDLYFKNSSGGKKFEDLEDKELNFSEGTLMHLNNLFSFDRYATSYCRYEYLDYQIMIEKFNSIEAKKANKSKYIFTLHPNIPNSTEQILIFYEINKAIEENDLEYLDDSMVSFFDACKKRQFEKPNIFDEYYANISKCLPNMMKAIGMAALRIYLIFLKPPDFILSIP